MMSTPNGARVVSVIATGALALLAAGCGGSGSPSGVATVTTSKTAGTAATSNGALAFARCMRSNGIPNWPDPTASGQFDKTKLLALGVSPTRMRAIEDGPCKNVHPSSPEGSGPLTAQQQRTRLADGLSFARCIRSHGITRFPDPTAQGQLTVEMVRAQGIDVHSASVLHVVQMCLPASHGALTPAKIREALNGG